MRFYFDTRLGYLVNAPGSATALSEFSIKAGDTASVEIEFGQSADPTGSAAIIEATTWTKLQLPAGTVIKLGFKESGDYTDGTLLVGAETYTYSDFLYTFDVSLNTTALNTAMSRDDADETNDVESLETSFEITYQPGGSGGWLSSTLPVTATIYHDVLLGDESTPTNAASPDNYLLKQDGIRWYSEITSQTGGTASDFDSIATVDETVGLRAQFQDTDGVDNIIRDYILTAGTDAESAPDVIRPDDYDGTTNQKVWILGDTAFGGMSNISEDTTPQLGGTLDTNGEQVRWSKGADVASATALTLGDDGNYFDITGTTTIASIATKAIGTHVKLQFDGALTLTHSADLFLCNNASDIVTAAGDHIELVEYATGQWRATNYQRADGSPLTASTAIEISNDSTPQLGGPLDSNSNQVRWSKGSDIASASSLTPGDDGNYFDVTGTATISSIASKGIGTRILLQFDGAATLTHSAADLVLITGSDITTAAGDHAEFVEYASGDWRMVSYSKADGTGLSPALQADGSVDGTGRQTLSILNLEETQEQISSGVITMSSSFIELESESGTTDSLLEIQGGNDGDVVWLTAKNTHTITLFAFSGTDALGIGTSVDINSSQVYSLIRRAGIWRPFPSST